MKASIDIRSLVQSKTVWGLVIVSLAMLVPKLAEVNPDDVVAITSKIVEVVGLVLALYGRIVAQHQILIEEEK